MQDVNKATCCVEGCKGKYETWIDIWDDIGKEKGKYGRFPFCRKHYNKVIPYAKQKEKELIAKKEFPVPTFRRTERDLKHPEKPIRTFIGWAFVPLSIINEALTQ
jgi:hypothetical protein